MASIKGFELTAVTKHMGNDGVFLRAADLCHKGRKVGFIAEANNGNLPVVQIDNDYQEVWRQTVSYFKNYFYDCNDIATEVELFYFLLTLKEWEQALEKHLLEQATSVTIMEELDALTGYRTGSYKVSTSANTDEIESGVTNAQRYSSEVEPVWWKKWSFRSLDELNFC